MTIWILAVVQGTSAGVSSAYALEGRRILAMLVLVLFALMTSLEAFAQTCFGGMAEDCDGSGPSAICQGNGGFGIYDIVCDSATNGDTTGANFKAVLNTPYIDVYGTDSTGANFCCKMQAADPVINVFLLGGSSGDTIALKDGVGALTAPGGSTVEATVFGESANDTITGSDTTNVDYVEHLYGDAGNDTINAGEGNDYLYGGDNVDTLNGGGGNDNLQGGAGADTCEGGDGDDNIYGQGDGDTALNGGNGSDYISGGDGDDTIDGGNNNDVIYGDNNDDTIYGGAGFDSIWGGSGIDTISGQGDQDWIRGGDGVDVLYGGDGSDVVCGDAGSDTLHGDAGEDELWDNSSGDAIYSDGTDDCGNSSPSYPSGPCAGTLTSAPPECL